MNQTKKRNFHSPELEAKVGLEALRGVKTINEIGLAHGVHPVQVGQWKREIQEQASKLFEGKRGPKPASAHNGQEALVDPCALAMLKHYRSLMPMAMDARKPMFALRSADGAIGAHIEAVRACHDDFLQLAKKVADHAGLTL